MTGHERTEIADLHADMLARFKTLDVKVDAIERRLDRWDGAISLIKAAASVLGVGGIGLILAALVSAAGK